MIEERKFIELTEPELFIFRTNIKEMLEFVRLKRDLEEIRGIHGCTIDLEDCDKVLRVECENVSIEEIVEKVSGHGFLCQELED